MTGSLAPFLTLAWRNLASRTSRTLLTVAGIILGVAVILAVAITNESTITSIRRIFDEASGRSHLVVTSSSVTGTLFDPEALGRTARVPGVLEAVPSVSHKTLLAAEADSWGLSVSVGGTHSANDLLIFGIQPGLDREVRDYEVLSGEFLPDDTETYAALLVQDYATDKELEVGDDLVILTASGQESLRIVGIISKSGPGMQNNGAVAIVPIGTVQAIFEMGGDLNQIDVVAEPGLATSPAQLETLKVRLAESLGDGYQVSYPAARGKIVPQMLASYQLGLSFFSAVALFVGAFLIYNTFTMTIVERTREIGMLRTLGATRTQVGFMVFAEAILLGCLGSSAGVGFGILLSYGLTRAMTSVAATEITQLDIPGGGLLNALLVGLGVTLVSALLPIWRARNISPLEALRAKAQPQNVPLGRFGWMVGLGLLVIAYLVLYHVPFRADVQYQVGLACVFCLLSGATLIVPATIEVLERVLRPVLSTIYGGEGKLGASNIRRAKGRTTLTVAALMVGIAMVIGIQTLTASFELDIDNWVKTAIGGDLYVRSPIPMRDEFGQRLLSDEAVVSVSPVTYRSVRYVGPESSPDQEDTILFTGIDPVTYPQVASFVLEDSTADLSEILNLLADGDNVLISTTMADHYGLATGDRLPLETRRGRHDFLVVGVVMDFSSQGYVVNGNRADIGRYFGKSTADQFIVALKPGLDPQVEADRLEDRYGKSRHIVVETATEFRQKVSDLTAEAFGLFDVLGLIGIIIAALGVVNTLTMNVLERQREIGGLRSLGMTKAQVARMVLAESGAMGAIGVAFGIVFGFFLSKVLLLGTQMVAGYTVHYHFPPAALLISLIIGLAVSQLAALYPAQRAASVRIVEAIQHE